MGGWIERGVFLAAIAGLTLMLVSEGRTQVQLARDIPITAKALYDRMAKGETFQLIDIRPLVDDEDEDVGGFENLRLPKSTPMPGCSAGNTPNDALAQIKFDQPAIIITAKGNPQELAKCGAFKRMRFLQGGVTAWSEAGYPEDEGEYTPPKPAGAGGGGCL